jgi:hypothetical protein
MHARAEAASRFRKSIRCRRRVGVPGIRLPCGAGDVPGIDPGIHSAQVVGGNERGVDTDALEHLNIGQQPVVVLRLDEAYHAELAISWISWPDMVGPAEEVR